MTEEMVGGQHRRDECDTEPSVRGEQTNATIKAYAVTQRVCPKEANTNEKALANGRLRSRYPVNQELFSALSVVSIPTRVDCISHVVSRYV
jgi:hypothetical protein